MEDADAPNFLVSQKVKSAYIKHYTLLYAVCCPKYPIPNFNHPWVQALSGIPPVHSILDCHLEG